MNNPDQQDPYQNAMSSLTYDSQSFNPDNSAAYPNSMNMIQQNQDSEDFKSLQANNNNYPSPGAHNPLSLDPYHGQNTIESAHIEDMGDHLPEIPLHVSEEPPSPGRSRAISKPDRAVTKTENGRYVCLHPGCNEETKDFGRKCEWSKHM